ncbi:cysteine desulfurase-like protein [Enemella dayhoffiae]|uniref:Cysteine desulfurase-like protein n=1 Tax=Enemella dayhoffiae TaxID=2016507 RepID=A0A255HA52_9ACTN|nr:cysteine desulfurase-like protein [Enemella dayhoffiae]OYO24455.1 cysteine desulfurase-like protein [Enemella dayhoffiae]
MSTAFDAESVRRHFPALTGPDAAAHFDGPGGTQTPTQVAQAIAETLTAPLANRGRHTTAERNAEATVTGARRAMADLLGSDPGGIVFGRSMTQLTMDLARGLAQTWSAGDEVVVSRLDHDANIRPWIIAAGRAGATVRWAEFDPETGELPTSAVEAVLGPRTRLVAVTAASNLIGTMPDLPAIAAAVHAAGALLFADAVHYAAHEPVDRLALGADLLACSPYKFCGPHCGVLAGDVALLESIHPDKLAPSTDQVPERFELGTLPYELLAGTTAAVDFLADLVPGDGSRRERLLRSLGALEEHEQRLRARIEAGLAELGATVWSRAARRTPTLLFAVPGVDSQTVYAQLAARGVNAPASSFYALECSRALGLGEAGAVRVGLAPYTTDADVDRLLEGLRAISRA